MSTSLRDDALISVRALAAKLETTERDLRFAHDQLENARQNHVSLSNELYYTRRQRDRAYADLRVVQQNFVDYVNRVSYPVYIYFDPSAR